MATKGNEEGWEKILRKPLDNEKPHLAKFLMEIESFTDIQLLKEKVSDGEISPQELEEAIKEGNVEKYFAPCVGWLEQKFPSELLDFALKEGYIEIITTDFGCPPELDQIILSEKGKAYLKKIRDFHQK